MNEEGEEDERGEKEKGDEDERGRKRKREIHGGRKRLGEK